MEKLAFKCEKEKDFMKLNTRDLSKISLMAALSFIGSFISIPIGPVPVTLQTLFVLLTALLLNPQSAFFAQLLHLLLSVLVRGGQIFLSPSFGFLIAFIIVAPIISYLKKTGKVTADRYLVILATGLIYVIGTPYMAIILNVFLELGLSFSQLLISGVLLFLPGDGIKAILAVVLANRLRKIIKH